MNNKNLMIIESPNKIKTISKYLHDDSVEILATYGHLRDLSKFGMGFTKNLDPIWVNVKLEIKSKKTNQKETKKSILKQILETAKSANKIYLSTDPDREGEAIAWHVYSLLPENDKQKCVRVVFNEITTNAIHDALKHPRKIDMNQVNSYLARRVLDREFGYKLSGFVKRNFGGISAGRVQSVALKFLKLREDEIIAFIPESWYTIEVILKPNLKLNLKLIAKHITNYKLKPNLDSNKICFADLNSAQTVIDALDDKYVFIKAHQAKQEKISPKNSLKTSTLHQEGISRFKISSRKVESIAQKLYEGVMVNQEIVSLISYPRTDRTDLSQTFINEAQKYIVSNYGNQYCKTTLSTNKKTKATKEIKANLVQGAHEAIRPTDLNLTPDFVKPFLEKNEFNLYCLIWIRAIGSLMSQSVYEYKYYDFENNGCLFNCYDRHLVFDGFEKLYSQYKWNQDKNELEDNKKDEKTDFNLKNKLVLNKSYQLKEIQALKHNKKPPARYNEASLIKALEQEGIGRPSTYASITSTVLKRDYANKKDASLVPTEKGINIINNLQKNFVDIMSFDYTKKMEKGLDEIANNKKEWKAFLNPIFDEFRANLAKVEVISPKIEHEYANKNCPLCSKPLIFRQSFRTKNANKFIGCSGFPKCRYIESLIKPDFVNENCPKCKNPLVRKKSKYNTFFIGCSTYPKCQFLKEDPLNPKPNKVKKIKDENK